MENQEAKTPTPTQSGDWKKSFNDREKEEMELSIKSINEFSKELERLRTTMKSKRQ
ncbi:hypothetical protein V7S43_008260 [Phytophthora oleae]|uniref:Uncharacterized protein n=1 Tax=Phytophthora oleae TaxID=2107226 RepID=A0ABD3FIQ7_9STRA